MASVDKALDEALKDHYLEIVSKALADLGEEILRTKSNEFCFPVVDGADNEKFVRITVSVPKGERGEDGEAYDGYAVAEDFKIKLEQKAEKAKEEAKKKAEKIAKDEKARAKRAEVKVKREAAQ